MDEYTVKPFHFNDYPLMKELFWAAFHTQLDEGIFAKKYNTKELGHEVIGFIAVHTATQTPAAYYGVFPVKVLIENKEVLAAQSGDTMTHPAHQRKGLFVKLAQMTYASCHEANIQFVFGQPNKNSYHGLVNKLHFRHLDDIDRYHLKPSFKTLPLPKLFQKAGLFKYYFYLAKMVLKKRTVSHVSSFTNPLLTNYGKVIRNDAYVNYKDEADKLFIEIDDAVFWMKLTDVLWIGDVNNYEAVTPDVLKKLKRLAFVLGYNTVSFQFNKSLPKPAFLKTFKKQSSEASCFLYLNEELNGHNFVLTGADFDTW